VPERQTLISYIEDLSKNKARIGYIYRTQYRKFIWRNGEIYDYARRTATFLQKKGIKKGDRIILWGENSPEWVIAFLGCLLTGAISVPVDDSSPEEFTRKIINKTKARIAFFSEEKNLQEDGLSVIYLDKLRQSLSDSREEEFSPVDISPQDTVEIIFTSGTTAEPKGVIINHWNILSNLNPIEDYVRKYGSWVLPLLSLRFLSLLPFSHMFGQSLAIFIPMMIGRTVVLINSLNPSTIQKVVKEEKVWVLITIPRILVTLRDFAIKKMEKDGKADFRQIYQRAEGKRILRRIWKFRKIHKIFGWRFRAIVVGGAALDKELEDFWSTLGMAVVQGYGMTETAPIISINNPLTGKRGSIGRTVGDQQIKVDKDGEILVKGPHITNGYFSEEGVEQLSIEDGWFRTGDLGEMDSEGYIYFKGRKKDVIVTAEGMNVFPEDVESILNQMPEIKDSAVIGIETNGREEVHAVLLLSSLEHDASAVIKSANESLSPHQRIKSYTLWEEEDFPRTPTLKIKKREVVRTVNASRQGEAIAREEKTYHPEQELFHTISEISGRKDISPGEDASLANDFGLGSIDRVELLCELEDKYRIRLDETEFSKCETVEDVKKVIEESCLKVEEEREIKPPRWAISFPMRFIRIIGQYIFFFPLLRYYCSIKVMGTENLKDVKHPFILAANHQSHIDAAVVLWALPLKLRTRMAAVMMQEIFFEYLMPKGIPLRRRLLVGMAYFISTGFFNAFPFPTESDFRNSMEYAGELVEKGFSPLIFPEGGRSASGNIERFKPGIGMMVQHMKLSVLPVRIDGLREILPLDKNWPVRGDCSVKIGKLMTFEGGTYSSIAQKLEAAIREL
jgi:long-chain acyl-CoA synthetase